MASLRCFRVTIITPLEYFTICEVVKQNNQLCAQPLVKRLCYQVFAVLHYTHHAGALFFASNNKTVAGHTSVRPEQSNSGISIAVNITGNYCQVPHNGTGDTNQDVPVLLSISR